MTLNKFNNHRGKNTKYMPYVFTEYSSMMLAGLLKSENSIIISLNIIKSFVAMRKFINNNKEIIIIDNYIDKAILDILLYKNENVKVKLYTKNIKSKLDIDTFNLQYPKVEINKIDGFHDRFIIIDNKTLYHIGAL